MARFALLIVDADGENYYVRESSEEIAIFASRSRASKAAEFWRDGLGDEVQSVNVVKVPVPKRRRMNGVSSRKSAEGL